jgi:aminopeptidase YwaD
MKHRIHIYLFTLLLVCLTADSQKISKSDNLLLTNLQLHIRTLSTDTAGGCTMGTPGEKAAGDYVILELSNAGVRPRGDNNGWLQTFTVDEGRQIGGDALLTVDDHPLAVGKEWFPLSISPVGEVNGSPAIALQESGVPWFQDLKEWFETEAAGPRFDLLGMIRSKAAACAKKGATALILYNSATIFDKEKLGFDPKDKSEAAIIPVVFITREAKQKYLKDESASADIRIRISYTGQHRTGHNVVGFLDNGASTTVVIGSRFSNSSGLAGMIELARLLSASKLHGNNYLFVVFTGSDPAWLGSDYYGAHPVIDPKKVNFFLELDRLGSLNDTTHALMIGGDNTSPSWTAIGNTIHDKKTFTFHYHNIARQRGDHTNFYREQIPVLLFSTDPGSAGSGSGSGSGSADDPTGSINYHGEMQIVKYIYFLIEGANPRGRLPFSE